MSLDLCNTCAITRGLIPSYGPATTNLTGSIKQLDKFLAHTQTGSRAGDVVSIYSDPTYDTYKDLFFSSIHSGSYHRDDRGRESMVFLLGRNCGFSWDDNLKLIRYAEDAVRVVCFRDTASAHHYSQDSATFKPSHCAACGAVIL
jgi:hypothetical protein